MYETTLFCLLAILTAASIHVKGKSLIRKPKEGSNICIILYYLNTRMLRDVCVRFVCGNEYGPIPMETMRS